MCRHRPNNINVHAHGEETGGERGFQHVTGEPRILAMMTRWRWAPPGELLTIASVSAAVIAVISSALANRTPLVPKRFAGLSCVAIRFVMQRLGNAAGFSSPPEAGADREWG